MTLLAARGLVKRYGGVPVLKDVDLDVEAGEIHALVGENGAGKSTLIKILAGAVRPDAGTVTLAGLPLPAGDPVDARRRGVSVVHQEFTLVPDLSVADNITLGREPSWWHAPAAVRRRAAVPLHRLGIAIDPSAKVRTLSVASQQLVEIARALAADARVLILDEPTAALPPGEIERLFTVLRDLRSGGLGIVYISHRLDEVFTLADRITVLRDGAIVRRAVPAELTRADLITAMIGRELSAEFPERHPSPGEAVLETAGLCSPPGVRDVSFSIRAGEILGLAGLAGAGRTSTALALAGARRSTGSMRVRGRAVSFRSPHEAVAAGVVYVTEDRKARGIIPTMAIGPNVTLASLRQFASGGWLRTRDEGRAVREAAARFDVRAGSLQQLITTLSGGNQQKVLLARAALATPAVLILDEPTRGVDVGARAEIYAFMNQLTASGLAVLMISSDLPEVLGMSDRIVVMREGRTVGELGRAAATADAVMSLAARAA